MGVAALAARMTASGGNVTSEIPWKLLAILWVAPAFGGPITVNLGSASSFGLLGETISNTGASLVAGNVGGVTSVTGFPPGTATGSVLSAGPIVSAAYSDFENALNQAAGDSATTSVLGLASSQAFTGAGVYAFSGNNVTSTAGIMLTFDAQSDSSSVFVMQIAGSLTIDGPITFNLIDGAQASNIYWVVGNTTTAEGVTISPSGLPVTWDGNILAGAFTESANTGGSGVLAGSINGCVMTVNANTLAGQTIVNGCTSSVPEPGSAALLGLGFLACAWLARLKSYRPVSSL